MTTKEACATSTSMVPNDRDHEGSINNNNNNNNNNSDGVRQS
jgi:hypothetical protein